ncbi:DNA polymerase delta subunit 4 [Tetrabaena socialis]|uniref:DNA polymerase delta subunit 4 n=1 Tax=Tetrabaena socialis TaxID=47790 RepID=A0A2J7ZZG5_9CHLO|nr:DNA polymerase delta subunit 4 [Tetrabaena socialis]|eukprot:PNH05664.1 DNA polymerase delta subunit 4 [Tetrabaena socialis]
MMSKKENTISASFRQSQPGPSAAKTTRGTKRKKAGDDAEVPTPEVLARSQGAADLSEEEQRLRQFDLQTKYGPCAGISRLERWERAVKFGLEPPEDVRDIIMAQGGLGSAADRCLWHGRI